VKQELMDWEKIFINPISDKGQIPKIHKEVNQLISKKVLIKNVQRT
jgi:hypothetical protein